ncbi:MAG: hypothetical protein V4629_06170 [Pseudomonadota bacterium]
MQLSFMHMFCQKTKIKANYYNYPTKIKGKNMKNSPKLIVKIIAGLSLLAFFSTTLTACGCLVQREDGCRVGLPIGGNNTGNNAGN